MVEFFGIYVHKEFIKDFGRLGVYSSYKKNWNFSGPMKIKEKEDYPLLLRNEIVQ